MASLIDNILSLEQEADHIIEEARAYSKNILKSADDSFHDFSEEQNRLFETRLAQFREKQQKEFDEHVAGASQEHARKLNALERLSDEFKNNQVNKIIDRFNNW